MMPRGSGSPGFLQGGGGRQVAVLRARMRGSRRREGTVGSVKNSIHAELTRRHKLNTLFPAYEGGKAEVIVFYFL